MATAQKTPVKVSGYESKPNYFTQAKMDANAARIPGGYGAPKPKAEAPTNMFEERGLKLPSDRIADNIMNGHGGKRKPKKEQHPIDAAIAGVTSDAKADRLALGAVHKGTFGKATTGIKPRISDIAEVHGKENSSGTNGSGKVTVDAILTKASTRSDAFADNLAAAAAYFTPRTEVTVDPGYPLRG
jgi:hypothetical protein